MIDPAELGAIAGQFQVTGAFAGAAPIGSGHIHDSFEIVFALEGASSRYVLQRINTHIFRRPDLLMQNMQRVTLHIAGCAAHLPDASRRTLLLISGPQDEPFVVDARGDWWRMFRKIDGVRAYDTLESTDQAWQVAHAFGKFQVQMASLPGPPLHDTIPGFHDTHARYQALQDTINADAAHRAQSVPQEIAFATARAPLTTFLQGAGLPPRIVHNDTKISNVLVDGSTGEALCVIDLDTVMQGLAVHDFGDMVRSMTSGAPEDEHNLSHLEMQFEYFKALLQGYLAGAGSMLTVEEKLLLPAAAKIITFENGIRFLADYLAGDTYYKIHYPEQNLRRCRTHFRLVESMEAQEQRMMDCLRDLI